MPFQCSICDEPSTRICVRCTKDACDNHICEKCQKCSDCCECEVALNATPRLAPVVHTPPAPPPEFEAEAEPEAPPAAGDEPAAEAAADEDGALAEAATEPETEVPPPGSSLGTS